MIHAPSQIETVAREFAAESINIRERKQLQLFPQMSEYSPIKSKTELVTTTNHEHMINENLNQRKKRQRADLIISKPKKYPET